MFDSNEVDKNKLTLSETGMQQKNLIGQSKNYDSIIKQNEEEIQRNEEELKQLESQIKKEQKRVTKLKLQRDQFENEAQKVKQDNESKQKYTRTIMEGYLHKPVSRERNGRIIKIYVWLDVATQGTPILSWAQHQMSNSVERAIVKGVFTLNDQQAFKVELGFGRYLKAATVVFADHDQEVLKRWVSHLETALTAWNSGRRQSNEKASTHGTLFAREITFLSAPLGFGVATEEASEEISVSSIQNTKLCTEHGLRVGMRLTACNAESLNNVAYDEAMAILKTAVRNISEKNPVTIRFQGHDDMSEDPTIEEKRMEDLYPDASSSLVDHPMLAKPVFAKYKDDKNFQKLCQDLMTDPKKLDAFLKRKY